MRPTFVGFYVFGVMVRFYYGIFSATVDNGIFKPVFNIQIIIHGHNVYFE